MNPLITSSFTPYLQGVTKVSETPRKSTDEFYILAVIITAVIEPICVLFQLPCFVYIVEK